MHVRIAPKGRAGGDAVQTVRADPTARTVQANGTTFGPFHSVHPAAASPANLGHHNKALFAAVGVDLVRSALEGVNSALLALGSSGYGALHAVGDRTRSPSPTEEGLTPRILRRLVEEAAALQASPRGGACEVRVRYVEVCGEEVRDLLAAGAPPSSPAAPPPPPPALELREDSRGIYAKGAACIPIASPSEAVGVLQRGGERLHRPAAPDAVPPPPRHALVIVDVTAAPPAAAAEEEGNDGGGAGGGNLQDRFAHAAGGGAVVGGAVQNVVRGLLDAAPSVFGVRRASILLCDLAGPIPHAEAPATATATQATDGGLTAYLRGLRLATADPPASARARIRARRREHAHAPPPRHLPRQLPHAPPRDPSPLAAPTRARRGPSSRRPRARGGCARHRARTRRSTRRGSPRRWSAASPPPRAPSRNARPPTRRARRRPRR